jgi:tRNA threonylcarbamoyladenosine modification (KEOPS) complex Cgi121 subunit
LIKIIVNIYQCDDLTIFINDITLLDIRVGDLYDLLKAKFKNINIVFINPDIIFGLDHILGIIKIIKENSKREEKGIIKNSDIEFLLRICYTNQISTAFEKLEHCKRSDDNNNNSFIYILFSKSLSDIKNASTFVERYDSGEKDGAEKDAEENTEIINTLIGMSDNKKAFILKLFFNKELKDVRDLFFIEDNNKFQKFLLERAAISLR